ncbi:MAG: transketolase [Cyclobacteriaceae bacterium]|nr:transketolase [Cyclobacteriaceae bacterium]
MNPKLINRASNNLRILSAAMPERAKSGHPGGAMGGADFINVLFSEFLRFDPEDMTWINRDRFFLDPGHMSPMIYSILHMFGLFSTDDLKNFRQWGSKTPGHPERDIERGIENTSGPLGQGHAFAVGAAIAERFLCARFGEWMSHRIFTYISDGGIQEEISQGAGRIAGFLGLSNLVMFYDSNDIQLSSPTEDVSNEDTVRKYESWGWKVIMINGNDQDQIRNSLFQATQEKDRPTLIIGKTIMGKGAITSAGQKFEKQVSTHGMPLSKAGASFENTVKQLGGDPDDPFKVFPKVKEYFDEIRKRKITEAREKKAEQKKWEKAYPELAEKLKKFFALDIPRINYEAIEQKAGTATRTGSKVVLAHFADVVENMIVASADLSNSDNTDGFLKKTKPFTRGDFSGAFLQAGVSELTMAALANGMALHGGVIPACGTFFVFSDFMKPSVRLAALMQLPVKYIWTHDAFRVGEDGPTHQPVEQEAQIRLLENLKNHQGKRSMLVLRPADSFETSVCWKIAMETKDRPSALLLSRQNIGEIPVHKDSTRYQDALGAEKGAYIIQDEYDPDVILVGNGSEVSTLVAGANLLRKDKKLKIRIVSAPSEGLFRDQDVSYQKKILPTDKPVFGLTAGLPVTLQGLVGPKGKVFGLDHFGYSAPFQILDEKFGFTAESVYKRVLNFLNEYSEKK